MRRAFLQLLRRNDGASAAEFALVLPLLLIFLLGMIDVGRYMWSINKLEKATQMGARMAVVTDMVPTGLANTNFGLTLGQGAPIPASSFGAAECDKTSGSVACNCLAGSTCPALSPINSVAFQNIATRMEAIAPMIADTDIRIRYTNAGVGYAGDPNGPDVAPIVTVSAVGVDFVPLIFQVFGGNLGLPTESASLTLEDGQGTTSN